MTTKTKTRPAPAAKPVAVDPAPKEANSEPIREISEIRRLVTRWRWLEADQEHQAACAATDKESERLIGIHNDEQEEIEHKLANLVPESFSDVGRFWNLRRRWSCNAIGAMAPLFPRSGMSGKACAWYNATN